ncbi:phage tail protein [Aliihoeflea sp. 40Bstr573]|uniref:phage tail tip fiber protein n=1 Tax=Aliihoeflea sp. 40Bstr573 TaxID=2696467 RepID=UPI002094BE94|nr:phage tail protein [Aliihoeflea sp. 40Bstr573]MCO6386245.1 phage tail protein [Aliihoeflea sp. 40Bstr573]
MAIFTAIGGAIAGALFAGSALAATVISGALAFGANLLVSYLTRPKKRSYTAVQGEVQFGGNVPVGAMFGTGLVKGQRAYYAKWGSGNKYNAELFILSNGWCDGLEPEVYFYGKRHVLIPTATVSNEVARYQVSGFGEKLTIRFYDGRPGQAADGRLVSVSSSSGTPWKATSTCAGMAYVIVEREYDEALFEQGVPDIGFILRGLRLYDPRKDSTVAGGSGAHRLDNAATWEFSQNPAIQRLNYQLGLRGLISSRTLIGEGKSLGQLDLGTYFAAMNVCDTPRNGKPTYQAALYVVSDDDHTEVLKEFDDAMAGYGLNRRGLSGVLVGAPQIPVAAITADDIPTDRAQQVQLRKSSFDLYNHLSGQFISKEDQWNPASLKPVYVNADIAADGRTRQTSNDFLQVSDPDIAQYLLSIRYRQNRKGGSATVPVSRRLGLRVQEGEWVTFEGRTWLVREWQCDEAFNLTLVLAETGADIYSEGGIEPGPIVLPSTPPINPSVLSTVQNFAVEVGMIQGAEGYQVPALRFTWTPPEDPTITSVRFLYVADAAPSTTNVFEDATADVEAGEYITTKNVVSGRFYTARATITTRPDRFKTFTPWVTTATVTGPFTIYLDGVVEEANENTTRLLEWSSGGAREAIERARLNALAELDDMASRDADRQVLRREIVLADQSNRAAWSEEVIVLRSEDQVLAQRLEEVQVELDTTVASAIDLLSSEIEIVDGRVTANAQSIQELSTQVDGVESILTIRAQAGGTGIGGWASFGVQARVGSGDSWSSAAMFIEVSGGQSRVVVVAGQFIITNGVQDDYPFIFQDGVLTMNATRVNQITAGIIRSPDSRMVINLASGSLDWYD